jgi:hypothetical protein
MIFDIKIYAKQNKVLEPIMEKKISCSTENTFKPDEMEQTKKIQQQELFP